MKTTLTVLCFAVAFWSATAFGQKSAQNPNPQDCSKVPDYGKLKAELTKVVKQGKDADGGLGNQEWATVVNRDGIVCAVVFSGPNRAAQWPGSRLVSASKANTANAFSTNDFALSSGNVYSAAQPGQSLYGIIGPPNPNVAYSGNPQDFGQQNDPMVGKPIGGVIVFGGGLPLYSITRENSWAAWASAETLPVRTMWSPGKLDTHLASMPFPWASRRVRAIISSSIYRMVSATAALAIPRAKVANQPRTLSRSLSQSEPVGPKH
jgi:hypothetical protein